MPDPEPPASAVQELVRALRSGDLDGAAEVLSRIGTLFAIPPPAETMERLEREGETLRVAGGLTREGDFVPFYFTDPDRARAYAVEHGFLDDPDGAMFTLGGDPADRLRACLERGFGGIVLNPGTESPAPIDRDTVAELARRMGVGWEGEGEAVGAPAATAPTASGAAGGDSAPAGGRAGSEGRDRGGGEPLRPPPHALDLADRVRKSPDLETLPPPDVEPTECGRTLQELRGLWAEDRIRVWELLDTLAYRMAFHVPVRPEPVQGLRWPLVARHPRDEETPSVWIFTDPDHAREAMASLPEEIETVRLSGLEAFRWIWAAPTPVEEIVMDLYPGSPGPFSIPDAWILSVFYPHFLDVSDLDRVERTPLGRIGELPGARGTKPECLRTLVEEWRELVSVEDEEGGAVDPLRHDGRRFRPVFSGPDRYFEFDSARPDRSGIPVPMKDRDEAPFREWLLGATDCDGVILDPEGPHPLPLDHTDLAVLALWTGMGRRPDGTDLVVGVASIRDELGPGVCGRIVADWPRYYWALQPGEEDRQPQAMTLPGRDACPVFTSEEKIKRFLEKVREWELVEPSMQPLMYLTGWPFNVFREMLTRYRDGGWINPRALSVARELGEAGAAACELLEREDPDAADGEGLEVAPEMVRSALARIEWRLQPRVPGFLATDEQRGAEAG